MDRTSSLGYQVNHLARLLALALRDNIAAHGVVPGQFAQLLALFEQDGITQNELCERVGIDQSTMAHTLKRMERDGLIQRKPDPADRRKARIVLTAQARKLEDGLVEAARHVNAIAAEGLKEEEVAAYLRATTRMIANLES